MLKKRVIRAWLALCQDPRQNGHGWGEMSMSLDAMRKNLDEKERGDRKIRLDDRLSMPVHSDESIDRRQFKIAAGNLYMFLPFAPDNIQLLAEMTGNWSIHGWWKQKDSWNPMMKPR